MENPIKCIISEVCMKDEQQPKLQPILVTFQHGTLQHQEAHKLNCRVSRDKKSKKRVFSVTTGYNNVRYNGSVESNGKNIVRTMIAIRNRNTNKVRLIEADNVLLNPFIKKQKKVKINKELNTDEKYVVLHKSFGSKAVQRRTEQKERSKTDVSMLTDKLIQAVAGVDVSVKPDESTTDTSIVPCNRNALAIEDVYKLNDLITSEELQSLEEKANIVIANANSLDKGEYSLFFLEHLPKILAKNEDQLESLEVLLYIDCLMKFFSSPFKDTKAFFSNVCPYSHFIAEKIYQEFTQESTSSKRLRPRTMKAKAVCHMIVLSLLILDFQLDLQSIVTSSKESIANVHLYSKALGASTIAGSKVKIILKLPLCEPCIPMSSMKEKNRSRK